MQKNKYILKNGMEVFIRPPKKSDLKELWKFINILSKEKTFITYQGEKISLKDEKAWLDGRLRKIKAGKILMLCALVDGKLVGNVGISLQERSLKHVGILEASVVKEYRDMGLGSLMMRLVIGEAKKKRKGIKIITLAVLANNKRARAVYKKLGFKEYGLLPRGFIYRGKYVDDVLMYKNI